MITPQTSGHTASPLARRGDGILITLGTLLVIEVLTRTLFRVPTPGAILLLPVAYAAFTGGSRAGIISATLMFLYALYYFAAAEPPWHYTSANLQVILVLTIVAIAMVVMVGSLKQRLEELNAALERRVAERTAQLEAANRALEQASRAKDRFLANMSHELRTPLNAIIGFTGTLLMKLPGPLTAAQEKQLRTIQTNGNQLLALISDLLDLVKIESGAVEIQREPVVCQQVIAEVAATLRALAEAKDLALEVMVPTQEMVVLADRWALSQILINLVNNAIKFTERGNVRIELSQRQTNAGRLTEISVVDTGIGLRPEDQADVFQAFSQVDASSTRRHEGTGLGLYLSQKLANLLGGQIDARSEYGRGSTFTLSIPEA
jgi:signal transduction histidine kinase